MENRCDYCGKKVMFLHRKLVYEDHLGSDYSYACSDCYINDMSTIEMNKILDLKMALDRKFNGDK